MKARLIWYLNRLRAMSLPEIGHRIHERQLRKSGKKIPASRFLGSTVNTLAALQVDQARFSTIATHCLVEWKAVVARAQAGKWHFLGKEWPGVPLEQVWHFDPTTGRSWPSSPYCFDIDYRHQSQFGDVKHVWEVNRLQILPIAAAVARADNDMTARDFVFEVIESWIRANPPFRGVNWCSGIELALRSINILAALALIGVDCIPESLRKSIAQCLNAHRFWLSRYPSRFSSANNHRIAELAGLYILGRAVPSLPDAASSADAAWTELMEELQRQIHSDGVGVEQSPTYTSFTLEWLSLALAVAVEVGDPLKPLPLARLTAAAEVLQLMADSASNLPRIGDDDEGRVILSGAAREADYPALILSSLAALLKRPDLAPRRDRAHLRQVWLGRAEQTVRPPDGIWHFDAGGYSIWREELLGYESLLVFDHGPLGYLSIAAHGHADALSLWWHLDGLPILVDAGTYLYHAGGQARDYFRGTSAHNTLCLDGYDQSTISGAFNWSQKAKAWGVLTDDGIEGTHDGYMRFNSQHYRRVIPTHLGFDVKDWLVGMPTAEITSATVRWIFNPKLILIDSDPDIVINIRENLMLKINFFLCDPTKGIEVPLQARIERVEISEDFGCKIETSSVIVTMPTRTLISSPVTSRFRIITSKHHRRDNHQKK